jgi:hypothetical protein
LSRRGAAIVLAATLSALTAAAACSGRGVSLPGDPTSIVRAAPDRTLASGTATVTVSVGVAVGPGLQGTGVSDLAAGRSDLVFRRTGTAARTRDRFEVVVVGADGYLSGAGPGWLAGSLPDVAAAARDRIAPLDDLLVRPGAGLALALLRGAKAVLPYGGEEILGASTLRYSFVVDLAAAAAAAPQAQRPALEVAARALPGVLEPADVWLDGRGRVRQLQFATNPRLRTTTTKGNALGLTEDGEYLSFIDIGLGAFGSHVVIRPPDAASVTRVAAA